MMDEPSHKASTCLPHMFRQNAARAVAAATVEHGQSGELKRLNNPADSRALNDH